MEKASQFRGEAFKLGSMNIGDEATSFRDSIRLLKKSHLHYILSANINFLLNFHSCAFWPFLLSFISVNLSGSEFTFILA